MKNGKWWEKRWESQGIDVEDPMSFDRNSRENVSGIDIDVEKILREKNALVQRRTLASNWRNSIRGKFNEKKTIYRHI